MKLFYWNEEKNLALKRERGISFEEILRDISGNGLLDILEHHNQAKYLLKKSWIL